MTERGPRSDVPGAPNPAEPAHSGDLPAPADRPPAVDLGAVRRTDAVIESLAAWRAAGSAGRAEGGRPARTDDPDPAVRLLRALIADVDDQGPGLDARPGEDGPEPAPPTPPGPGPRRRGPRTIVALGVAGAVLAGGGVAAAGSDGPDRPAASPGPVTPGVAEGPQGSPASDADAAPVARPRPPAAPPAVVPSGVVPSGVVPSGVVPSGVVPSGASRPVAKPAVRPVRSAARGPSGAPARADAEHAGRRLSHLVPAGFPRECPPQDRSRTTPTIVITSTGPSITVIRVGPRATDVRTAPPRRMVRPRSGRTARPAGSDLRRRLEILRRAAEQRD